MSEDYRSYSLAIALERIKGLEYENARLKQALGNIANYLSEFWLSDPNEDWDNLANHLYRAGFNCVRDWNGEPEPFIHSDNAEGPARADLKLMAKQEDEAKIVRVRKLLDAQIVENAKLRRLLGARGFFEDLKKLEAEHYRVLALLRRIRDERDKYKQALGNLAHYVTENWTIAFEHPDIREALESAGYDLDLGEPGEPEPFIHGDNAEGAEG